MGFAKRASLSAALTAPDDFPPAADLSTIRIVRRDKGPASIIALAADNRAGDEPGKPGGDGMFYKKGSATAATFRPSYWSYEPDPNQVAGPVASLERQLDARRRSNVPSAVSIEATPEEKPLASLGTAPAIGKRAMSVAPLAPALDQPAPTRASHEPAGLDTETVQALLRPMPDAAAMPKEIGATPVAAEPKSSTPALETMPPLAAPKLREEPTVPPVELSPPAFPDTAPRSIEVPVVAAPPPAAAPPASVAGKVSPPAPPADAPRAERSRPSAAPTRKRPSREAANRTAPESAEFDALGATIESVLATRWYGAERSGFTTSARVSRSDLAPVTPSGLIAELATVRKGPEPVAAPPRSRPGRIVAALSLVAVFALAFAAALLWRTGHGAMLPTRLLPALLGAVSLQAPSLALADIDAANRERATFS